MTKFKYYNLGLFMGNIDFEDPESKVFDRYIGDYIENLSLEEVGQMTGLAVNILSGVYGYFRERNFLVNSEDGKINIPDYSYELLKEKEERLFPTEEAVEIFVERNRQFPVDLIVYRGSLIGFIIPDRDNVHYIIRDTFQNSIPLALWKDSIKENVFGARKLELQMIKMRDGVSLATEVVLPENNKEKNPVIFIRTPYGRKSSIDRYIRFVSRGYVLVVQDVRGREDSEGVWEPKVHEMNDGSDSLDWIADQKWCNGKIGMIGGSYLGFVQWAAVSSGNKNLSCVTSIVSSGSPFYDVPRKGGTMMSGTLAWTFMMAESKKNEENMDRNDWDEILGSLPYKDIPEKALGSKLDYWEEWIKHENYDEYWQGLDWANNPQHFTVPSLLVSGWYDDNGMGTTIAWDIKNSLKSKDSRLILGPWCHKANTTREINGVKYPANSIRYDLDYQYYLWFEYNLKGKESLDNKYPRVQTYTLGKGIWTGSNEWPRENTRDIKFFLSKDNSLKKKPEESASVSYKYDPDNCPPFLMTLSENECNVPGNYKEVDQREDVIYFETEALEEELTIAGDPWGDLYLKSDCKDTDWIIRLCDVDPEGNSIRLSDGIVRAKYRNSFEHPELLEENKIYNYKIRMTKIANTFKKGHKIRFSITSGAKNLIFPNTNTGNDPMFDTEVIVANQTIHFGEDNPSSLRLPVES